MSTSLSRAQLLEREYLPVRAKLLEIAAALDRIQRVEDSFPAEPEWHQLRQGIQLLLGEEADRAENIQLLFSRDYDAQWRSTLELPSETS